ncbi:hypothetical protein S7711_10773 [Stachybotrys chartarum IBT 7711]|uniref:Uncharacterized protein n=1 Tax=Stachybotrys chartarum (strain CBS 109288 / IBT 7711) TaxID=1280523 RepID=A0A084AUC5_STACB|nr:hypothetical protein S7711_10773 [Stachybotrys chartarum IBT 7711]
MDPASAKAKERTIPPALACGMTQADGFLCLWHHKHNVLLSDCNGPALHSVAGVGLTEQKRRWRRTGVVHFSYSDRATATSGWDRLGRQGSGSSGGQRPKSPRFPNRDESCSRTSSNLQPSWLQAPPESQDKCTTLAASRQFLPRKLRRELLGPLAGLKNDRCNVPGIKASTIVVVNGRHYVLFSFTDFSQANIATSH